MLDRLSGTLVLHLATHGLLDYGPPGSAPGALVLAPEGEDPGLLAASEIMGLDLGANLAVLSACNTGKGRITGEGVVGLSYALMRAGVPSILVSLWSVLDDSTRALLSHFYRARRNESSLATALRRAMLATIDEGYDAPYQWAAFTLMGEWQQTPGDEEAPLPLPSGS